MLIVLSPIYVADTKVISHHDFVAPLSIASKRNGCFRNRYGRIITTKKISQK